MITLEMTGAIARITLNRPDKLNALTIEMIDQLGEALNQVDRDRDVRVVLLTSASEKAFCVGADIKQWTGLQAADMWRRWIRDGHRVFDALAGLRQPSIAVLNGYALGGGLELAMAADIRLASDSAQLGQPEVKIATIPGWGGTQRLPQLVGIGRAKQMIFSGERIDAQTAERWGLVNEVHPAETLMERAEALAEQIAENAPLAVQFAKQALNGGMGIDIAVALEGLAGAFAATTADAQEGLLSFEERRRAVYKGE